MAMRNRDKSEQELNSLAYTGYNLNVVIKSFKQPSRIHKMLSANINYYIKAHKVFIPNCYYYYIAKYCFIVITITQLQMFNIDSKFFISGTVIIMVYKMVKIVNWMIFFRLNLKPLNLYYYIIYTTTIIYYQQSFNKPRSIGLNRENLTIN